MTTWTHKIRIKHLFMADGGNSAEMTIKAAQIISEKLRAFGNKHEELFYEMDEAADAFDEASRADDAVEAFDEALDILYDTADQNSIWIA